MLAPDIIKRINSDFPLKFFAQITEALENAIFSYFESYFFKFYPTF